jgi:hypothetical protein
MGLQVRLRHALGERLIDLTERSVEEPLVVGRAKDADVKVPSVTVANQHCALFVHEGQWVLQDTSGGSTFLNGNPVAGATPLSIGDAIVLGSDANPATIEIDPAAAAQGHAGHPALGAGGATGVPSPSSAPPRPQAVQGAGYYAAPPMPPPQIRQAPAPVAVDAWGEPVAAENDPFAAWDQAGAEGVSAAPARRRKKPARQTSEGGMMLGIILCIAIIGGTGWYVYQMMNRPAPAPPPAPVETKIAPAPISHPNSIFDDGITGRPKANPAAAPTPEPAAPEAPPKESAPPPPPAAEPPAAPDSDSPAKPAVAGAPEPITDETWAEVVNLQYSPNYALAILKYDDYKHQHPGLHDKELIVFIDQAADRLWWKRIKMLCIHRIDLKKQMRQKDLEIKQQPAGDFLKTLKDEKEKLQADMKLTETRLTEDMGYTDDETPDAGNEEAIAKLRPHRDADKFGAWKFRVVNFIKNKHGATPWDGE